MSFLFRIPQTICRTRAITGDFSKFVIGAEHCHRQCGGLTARLSKYRDCSDEGAQETVSVRDACRREKNISAQKRCGTRRACQWSQRLRQTVKQNLRETGFHEGGTSPASHTHVLRTKQQYYTLNLSLSPLCMVLLGKFCILGWNVTCILYGIISRIHIML